MPGRFPRLSRVAIRVLEIGGAGCASALAASLLGSGHETAKPPAPMPPAIVRLAPADEQMIQHVREESLALAEKLRTATHAHSMVAAVTPAAAPPPAGAPPAAKQVKAAWSPAPRHEPKPAHVQTEAKQRAAETLSAQAASAVPPPRAASAVANEPRAVANEPRPVANDPRDERVTNVAAAPNEWPSPATATQVPSRLWSGASTSLRDAPRPPIGVGEYASSSM
ncbi:MAG TPA: hypothetical protein VH678_17705 [Xanthobacteraceae bacterium]|jgi:hypothetical protein